MKKLRTPVFIAYKTITQGSKSTGLLLVAIIAFSFLNILFISGILGGLSESITQTIISTASAHIQVKPQEKPTRKLVIEDESDVRAKIGTIPDVVATAREYRLSGTLSYDREKNGKFKDITSMVSGVDIQDNARIFQTRNHLVQGRFLSGENDEIVLGASLAGGTSAPSDNDFGGVVIGDKVIATYPSGSRSYTIVGVVDVGVGPGNSRAYVTAREAESIVQQHGAASTILVKVSSGDVGTVSAVAKKIQQWYPALDVKIYVETMADIGVLLDAFDLIGVIVSIIAIVVAMITMFALVYVNAVGKKKQIGILRAIGIDPGIIEYSYVFQSLFYTICGIGLGAILVFGLLQPYLLAHPIDLPFGDTALVLPGTKIAVATGALLLSGVLGGLVPARIVTKEKMLKAIWG